MNPELDKQLCEKYPKIFRDRNKSMQETCMYWGIDTGNGWYSIIDRLCGYIQNHIDWKRKTEPFAGMTDEEFDEVHQTVAAQVKEKFGGLRFYVDNADEFTRGLISMTEGASFSTCESCGNTGSKRDGGWIRTLCDQCHSLSNSGKKTIARTYKKKPVEIQAIRWDAADTTFGLVKMWDKRARQDGDELWLPTLEGEMQCKMGNWIIKGIKGEVYPCMHDIFIMTYDLVESE